MKTSVVIPSYNGKNLLQKNLPKVVEACKGCEIIVVDDASTDGTTEFLKQKFPQVKVIIHQKNLRFASSCNTGVKAASGEVVVLLNNDAVPRKDFLKPLISDFKNKNVFSVGCKEIEKKDGKEIVSGRNGGKFYRGFLIHWREKDQNKKDTLWNFGGSVAVNRKKYLSSGGMDPIYQPAYWEDIDLSWRARQKGWEIIFEPKSVVYHQHETTNIRELGKKQMQRAAFKNQIIFVWKNIRGIKLLQHFLWLPYHLLFTTIRSKGQFLQGFLWAIKTLI